jgi:hypothetical protein
MVVTDDQWFELQLLHDVPKLKHAVLAAAVGHDAIVQTLATVLVDDSFQLPRTVFPVDFFFLKFNLTTDTANTKLVICNGVYGLFGEASGAAFHG